jgi:hypothetical protein
VSQLIFDCERIGVSVVTFFRGDLRSSEGSDSSSFLTDDFNDFLPRIEHVVELESISVPSSTILRRSLGLVCVEQKKGDRLDQ